MTEHEVSLNHLQLVKRSQEEIGETTPTQGKLVFIFVWSVGAIVNALLAIATAIREKK